MIPLQEETLRRLLDATQILHAHGQGTFHERLFMSVEMLYAGTYPTFEVLDPATGSHQVEANALPYWRKHATALQERASKLFPIDHPLFQLMMRGHLEPTRLSDLTSERRFRRTDFYNEIFKPMDVSRQIAIPFVVEKKICGLTIARGANDFTDEDLEVARIFSRHLEIAYASDQILRASAAAAQESKRFSHEHLRQRGLTRRECEVLWWVSEGKRNSEIAVILGIACRTVELHLTSIFSKLGVENRTSAVANAFPQT